MGVLDFLAPQKSVDPSDLLKSDFQEGLKIIEIINGVEAPKDQIVLVGTLMPKDSFDFGGSQRIKKTYYPGSSEPSVQVFGPEEDDITIKGTFNLKRFKDLDLLNRRSNVDSQKQSAAIEYQQLCDAMRIRGNLVKITLGEWKRYGFILRSKFRMRTISDLDYELELMIVGFNMPKNYYMVEGADSDLVAPNKDLTSKMAEQASLIANMPTSIPTGPADILNSVVNDVAAKINVVTGFVNSLLGDIEKINASANRALGLIRNTRAFISQAQRRIGSISRDVSTLGAKFTDEVSRTKATIENIKYLNRVERRNRDINRSLKNLENKFAALAFSLPRTRHFVISGDTLQKLSIKYYGTADNWKKIMDYNRLRSTNLVVGSMIQIPKV